VASVNSPQVTKAFVSLPSVKKVLVSGQTKTSVVLKTGLQVDLRIVKPEQWGSALLYFKMNHYRLNQEKNMNTNLQTLGSINIVIVCLNQ